MPWIKAKRDFIGALELAFGANVKIGESEVGVPPNPAMGDLSLPIFNAAKKLGKIPGELALEIASKARAQGLIHAFEAQGPYINGFIDRQAFVRSTLGNKKTKLSDKSGKKILVEFVSPNTNKPLHLGHLRNAFLGHSISGMLRESGNKVTRSILYNDRGVHIMKSMLAYSRTGAGDSPAKAKLKGDHFVGKYYVAFGELIKKNPELEQEAQEWLIKWEKGDKKILALWRKMNSWAEAGFRQSLKRLHIPFDREEYESALYKKGKKIIFDALKKGTLVKDENGNIIALLEKWKMPNKVLLRADGTAVYATTDIALAAERWKKYKFNQLIYVVGMEQDLHFRQLFKIFEILKFPFASRCRHLSYNWVYLPEGRMKSREGRVVEADALLDEVNGLALSEIKKRNDFIREQEADARAEVIAQAALKYYLLEVDPKSDIHFNPSSVIALTGRTGPYIQYSHARISSILRKAPGKKKFSLSELQHHKLTDAEYKLFLLLGKYGDTVQSASKELNPSTLAKYLYELSKAFADFYEVSPVLKALPSTRDFRLMLVRRVREVLSLGLGLLGIDAPDKM